MDDMSNKKKRKVVPTLIGVALVSLLVLGSLAVMRERLSAGAEIRERPVKQIGY